MNSKITVGYQNATGRIFYANGKIVDKEHKTITTHIDNDPKISLRFDKKDLNGTLFCPKFEDYANVNVCVYRLWRSKYEKHLVLPDPNDKNDTINHIDSTGFDMNSDCFNIHSCQYHLTIGFNNGDWEFMNKKFTGDLGDPRIDMGFYESTKGEDILYLGFSEEFNFSIQRSSLS